MGDSEDVIIDDNRRLELVARIFWRERYLFAAGMASIFLLTAILAIFLEPKYTSEGTFYPTRNQESNDLATIAGQLGGLAGLTGVSAAKFGTNNVHVGLETLQSREFILSFVEREEIKPDIMAVNSWSPDTNALNFDADKYDATKGQWLSNSDGQSLMPSDDKVYKSFIKSLTVDYDERTSIVHLSFTHLSPFVAQSTLRSLVRELNSVLLKRDVEEAEAAVAYLHGQISKTSVDEVQKALYALIREQLKVLALANAKKEYFLTTIDSPFAAQDRSSPNWFVIVIMSVAVGTLFSTAIVTMVTVFRTVRNRRIAD